MHTVTCVHCTQLCWVFITASYLSPNSNSCFLAQWLHKLKSHNEENVCLFVWLVGFCCCFFFLPETNHNVYLDLLFLVYDSSSVHVFIPGLLGQWVKSFCLWEHLLKSYFKAKMDSEIYIVCPWQMGPDTGYSLKRIYWLTSSSSFHSEKYSIDGISWRLKCG